VKTLNDKEFKLKFDKPGNGFALLEVKVPIRSSDPKDTKTYWVKKSIQIVVQPNGNLKGRFV
jgi:hypothetical protein